MNQYTVLLVDDEEEVRNAIEQRINWEELGFEVIGKAQDFPLQAMPEMVWRRWKWRRNCSRMWS